MQLSRQIALACTMAFVSFTNPSRLSAQSSPTPNNTPKPPNNTSKPTSNTPDTKPERQQPPQPQPEKIDFSSYGRPGNRAGGGSRSPCSSTSIPLTALTPVTNWGKTVSPTPTFWFYVPYSPDEGHSGEFVLQDEKYNDVYRTPFTLPPTPGFVSLTIPSTQATLETDKWYFWSFKLYCGEKPSSSPVFVEGWVQRVALTPELETQLKAATTKDYVVYSTNGIWYDAVANLATLRLANTQNALLNREWAELLTSPGVGLNQLTQEPIIGEVRLLPIVKSSSKPITY